MQEPKNEKNLAEISKAEGESTAPVPAPDSKNKKQKTKESDFYTFIKPALALMIITSVMAIVMAAVNAFTAPRINEIKENGIKAAITELFPDGAAYNKLKTVYVLPVTDVWEVRDAQGNIKGYGVFITVAGFKSGVEALVGADLSGKCVGVRVLTNAETPGLGSRISDTDYLSQYEGKSGALSLKGDIDAVAGATVSSRALLKGVNAALALDIFGSDTEAPGTLQAESEDLNKNENGTEAAPLDVGPAETIASAQTEAAANG